MATVTKVISLWMNIDGKQALPLSEITQRMAAVHLYKEYMYTD